MNPINYKKIKQKLELLTCEKHHEHPIISIKKDKIEYKCCCDEFSNIIKEKIIDLMGKHTVNYVKDELEKMIKKINK